MSGIEIITIVSGALNVLGAIAGMFGWKKHQDLKNAADQVERVGEAVIQGVEACGNILDTDEAKQVKQSVQAVAQAAGVESTLHNWLVRLGLAKNRPATSESRDGRGHP